MLQLCGRLPDQAQAAWQLIAAKALDQHPAQRVGNLRVVGPQPVGRFGGAQRAGVALRAPGIRQVVQRKGVAPVGGQHPLVVFDCRRWCTGGQLLVSQVLARRRVVRMHGQPLFQALQLGSLTVAAGLLRSTVQLDHQRTACRHGKGRVVGNDSLGIALLARQQVAHQLLPHA